MSTTTETASNLWPLLSGFSSGKIEEVGLMPLLILMLISLLCSIFISFLYVMFYQSRATGSGVHRVFPLLGISVTAVFICIQFSLPLSLGLLGALSIVRFRTPIKEAEEIGFIMLVVATSLCCATFNLIFLGVILAVAVAGLLLSRHNKHLARGGLRDGMLTVIIPTKSWRSNRSKLVALLEKQIPKGRIDSIVEHEEEVAVSYSFLRLESEPLLKLQGEIRSVSDQAKTNVYYNRPGEV